MGTASKTGKQKQWKGKAATVEAKNHDVLKERWLKAGCSLGMAGRSNDRIGSDQGSPEFHPSEPVV